MMKPLLICCISFQKISLNFFMSSNHITSLSQIRGKQRGKLQKDSKCQKCLKFGHWTYQCKNEAKEYIKRPSRTELLLKPKTNNEPSTEKKYEMESRTGLANKLLSEKDAKKHDVSSDSSDDSDSSDESDSSDDSDDSSSSLSERNSKGKRRRKQYEL